MTICGWFGSRESPVAVQPVKAPPPGPPNPFWTQSISFNGSPLKVLVDAKHAGAICSLTYQGHEYVNNFDNGRQIQTAYAMNMQGEALNPTEAGNEFDGYPGHNPLSTSLLLHADTDTPYEINTEVQLAYWHPLPDGTLLSPDILTKKITLGWRGYPNVVQIDMSVVTGKSYDSAQMEQLTAYIDPALNTIWTYDFNTQGAFTPVPGAPVTISSPVPYVISTPDQTRAFALYASAPLYSMNTLGDCQKMDCAQQAYIAPFPAGTYSWTCFFVIGSTSDVQAVLIALNKAYAPL